MKALIFLLASPYLKLKLYLRRDLTSLGATCLAVASEHVPCLCS